MATFVLVHGAFHGGWCWREVARLLRAAGHEVFAPTLTGLGERAHLAAPQVNLSTHIQDVTALLRWEDLRDVVLVGHSYGGMVVTGAADREAARISGLVYLDALVPEPGRSLLDYQTDERRSAMLARVAEGDGWRQPPFSAGFYGVRDPAAQAWVDGKTTPHPFACMTEGAPLTQGGAARVERRLYVLCTDPPLPYMRQFWEKATPETGWRRMELATGHDLMVTAPGQTAEILLAEA